MTTEDMPKRHPCQRCHLPSLVLFHSTRGHICAVCRAELLEATTDHGIET